MTLTEFDEILDFGDLKSFAYDTGYDGLDDIVDNYDLNEYVDNQIGGWSDEGWIYLRDRLNEIPDDCDYYEINEYGDITGCPDFDEYKYFFREWCLENGFFEEDDDEAVVVNAYPPDALFEADFSLDELFADADSSAKKMYVVETTEEDDEEAQALLQMFALGA